MASSPPRPLTSSRSPAASVPVMRTWAASPDTVTTPLADAAVIGVVPGRAVDDHHVVVPARHAEVEQADVDQGHVRAGQVVDDDRVRPAEGEERGELDVVRVQGSRCPRPRVKRRRSPTADRVAVSAADDPLTAQAVEAGPALDHVVAVARLRRRRCRPRRRARPRRCRAGRPRSRCRPRRSARPPRWCRTGCRCRPRRRP